MNRRGIVRLVDEHRELVMGQRYVLHRWRRFIPVAIATVGVGRLQQKKQDLKFFDHIK